MKLRNISYCKRDIDQLGKDVTFSQFKRNKNTL